MLTLLGLAAAAVFAKSTPAWAQSAKSFGFDGFNIKLHAGATAVSLVDDRTAMTCSVYGAGKGHDATKLTGTNRASNGYSPDPPKRSGILLYPIPASGAAFRV